MRIRQIKPAFWTDVRLAELPPAVRLTFIGLWMIADDGGWFRCNPPQIANELYGYEPRRRRERAVSADIEALVTTERIITYDCGHAQVPHLSEHQRLAGETKQVLTIQREHTRCPHPQVLAGPGESPDIPDTVRNGRGTVRNVSERNGTVTARAGASESRPSGPTRSEFEEKVDRDVALGRRK